MTDNLEISTEENIPQKRSRILFESNNAVEKDSMEMGSAWDKNRMQESFASKLKPKDVSIDKNKFKEDSNSIRVIPVSADDPFDSFEFSKILEEKLYNQWKDAILIKIMGMGWSYPNLVNKLFSMWKLTANCELVDLGFEIYCLKGLNPIQRELILTKGPWQIACNFLLVRKWTADFRVDNDNIKHVITWVRVLHMPVETFNEEIIEKIVSYIEDPIKIDGNTYTATRGKYVIFCVQVPTNKPLKRGIRIRGRVYLVMYESIPSLYYTCGCVGHVSKECNVLKNVEVPQQEENTMAVETPTIEQVHPRCGLKKR